MTWRNFLMHPLPYQAHSIINRALARLFSSIAHNQFRIVNGLEHVAPKMDPFILVLNHTSRREAILLPALLAFYRWGKLIHFLADWNYRLVPGVDFLYRRAGVITVTRKPARPRILDTLRPLFRQSLSPMEQARQRLLAGDSVGIFPEGTVNRNPTYLLRGQHGAARLSIITGVPVIPVGIRHDSIGRCIDICIGAPQFPPAKSAELVEIRAWHAHIMAEIARLSGKRWLYGGDRI